MATKISVSERINRPPSVKPLTVPATRIAHLEPLAEELGVVQQVVESQRPVNQREIGSIKRSVSDGAKALMEAERDATSLGANEQDLKTITVAKELLLARLTDVNEIVHNPSRTRFGRKQFTMPAELGTGLGAAAEKVRAAEEVAARVSGQGRDEFVQGGASTTPEKTVEQLSQPYRKVAQKSRFPVLKFLQKISPLSGRAVAGGPVHIVGLENLPEGPFILALTHARPISDGGVWAQNIVRHTNFLARPAMVSGVGPKPLAKAMDAVVVASGPTPVHIGGGQSDDFRVTLGTQLDRNQIPVVMMEGRMNQVPAVGRLYPGAAEVALDKGVPIVAGAVIGDTEPQRRFFNIGKKQGVTIAVGKPVSAPEGTPADEHNVGVFVDQVKEEMAHQLYDVAQPDWLEQAQAPAEG